MDTPRVMDQSDPEKVQCPDFLHGPSFRKSSEIKLDDLDYETHLENYKGMFGYYVDTPDIAKNKILKAAEEEAKHHHAICVFNPLRDLIFATASPEEKLTNKNAKYFMLYGAARRTILIFSAYQEIRSIAYEKRAQPLSQNNQVTLSQANNNIYI